MLKEKHIPYIVKSKNGVEYTKYKKVLVDEEAEKLRLAMQNNLPIKYNT